VKNINKEIISISDQLKLKPVTNKEQPLLLQLMMDIYRPVYQHMWFDDGSGYVHSLFNPSHLALELNDADARYYFVTSENKTIGILRFLLNHSTKSLTEQNTIKLHRIYLAPITHGKGFGRMIMNWLQQFAQNNQQESIWLECMDTQLTAYNFYKRLGFEIFETFTLESPTMRQEYRGMVRMKLDI